jgi:type IV secretory pathway TraG/TraD family ATPase VirD4
MALLTKNRPKQFIQAPPVKDFCPSLDAPLLRFGKAPWTIGNACEGTLILGATGSGKSSGSGAHIAKSYLHAGMGGLVLCAKPDEKARWLAYAKACNREHHVIVMDGSCNERFNFLDYALLRDGQGSGQTMNLVTLFIQLAEAAQKGRGEASDPFWRDSMKEMLSHSMDALIAAYGRVRLHELQKFIETLPQPDDKRESGFAYQTMTKAYMKPVRKLPLHDWNVIDGYVFENARRMADKMRSGIVTSFTSLAHSFIKGKMHTLFCTDSTLVPELTHEGAIIIVDLPVKQWDTAGILASQVMKYLFQKAAERRNVNATSRPVFLWADECQFFLSEYDNEFQSTARSSRACTVYLTQNLSGIYSSIGGRHPEHAADALLGNLRTKIFHSNDNGTTNRWAAEIIGKDVQVRGNWSDSQGSSESYSEGRNHSSGSSWGSNSGPNGGSFSHSSNSSSGSNKGWSQSSSNNRSRGGSETIDYRLQPSFFAEGLRTGGPKNKNMVDAVLFQPGQNFTDTGEHWGICAFPQG